jgi:16S rRNA (guanine966-N2)-methyltransferase
VRITGGALRGRRVPAPPVDHVRPTAERVREAIFSMLGQDLAGQSVVDLCAGSGLLGLEALSRGASTLTLVDRDPRVLAHLRRTVQQLGLQVELVGGEAERLLRGGRRWDLVLLDPPYADAPEAWLRLAAPACARTLLIEHRAGALLPAEVAGLRLDRQRRYGDSAVAIYRRGVD